MSLHPVDSGSRAILSRALALALLLLAAPAWPGGSPETTLLVVNADSPISLAVANEYIRLRDFPEQQVLWLHDIPVGETIDIDAFRRHILDPIRNHFIKTNLGNEIDLIVYSAGFPYRVDFTRDLQRAGREYHKRVGNMGSLTGLTYFMHRVVAMDMGYLHPRANQYFRPLRRAPEGTGIEFVASQGFRSRHVWSQGSPQAIGPVFDRYYLSVMLGYTGMRGNSLPEIIDYLRRAAGADGEDPKGTVYLMENRNIRSRVRQPLFPAVQQALQAQGRAVEVIAQGQPGQDGRIPRNRDDIIGLVAGTRVFDWEASGSRILPGAIAESFTSYGGHFSHGVQTKLTEFLRHGAAGSSGAVQEPYSFVEKFPIPQLHQYYADGSSLAEAFYQSVSSPYQLIIIGEALARPFARFANIELVSPSPNGIWSGKLDIALKATAPIGTELDRIEIWINGRPAVHGAPGQIISLDTRLLADGYHEVRLVAVEKGNIETRSSQRWIIQVNNQGHQVSLSMDRTIVPYGDSVRMHGKSTGASQVILYQGRRVLAEADVVDGAWQASLDSRVLGQGQIPLYAEAQYPGGLTSRSGFAYLQVGQPVELLQPMAERPPKEGIRAVLDMGDGRRETVIVTGLTGGRGANEWGQLRPNRVSLAGAFEIRAGGLYELDLEVPARLGVMVNGVMVAGEMGPGDDERISIPMPLAAGWHRLEISYQPGMGNRLPWVVLQGPEPAFLLDEPRVRH